MRIGATFSATNARARGLDPQQALAQVIELGLEPLRLCGYWDQPPDDLDWQLDQAQAAGRQVLLTVGMKAPRWPEFHLPPDQKLDLPRGAEVGPDLPVASASAEHVAAMVERFRDRPAIAWWQVENEPLNRSGPDSWWISPQVLAGEVAAVRERDHRPVVVTAFGHFDLFLDQASGHRFFNPSALLSRGTGVEPELLALLQPGDVLGVDVYHSIGQRDGRVVHAGDQIPYLEHWLAETRAQGVECWVTELQAEPWKGGVGPEDVVERLHEVREAGVGTALLWGVEYWLAEAQHGRPAWLDAARAALDA